MTRAPIPKQSSTWDVRRNTSQVHAVPHDALPNALRSLASFRREQPALAAWIAEGAPTMTEDEHLARFGEPYRGKGRRGAEV